MKSIYILISIYNDWKSLKLLLKKINEAVEKMNSCKFNCLILNDASTIPMPEIKKPNNINSLKIINMKENKGHARCNAFGIKYLSKKIYVSYIPLKKFQLIFRKRIISHT